MARNLRSVLLNLTAGLAAGLGIAVSFVVELWSQSGSEYLLFSLPAFFFPAATWLRRQRSSLPPLAVFLLVDGWLILVYWWLASAALTNLSNLAAPLAVTAARQRLGPRCCATGPTRSSARPVPGHRGVPAGSRGSRRSSRAVCHGNHVEPGGHRAGARCSASSPRWHHVFDSGAQGTGAGPQFLGSLVRPLRPGAS
jgi:hypothetical protein